MMTFDVKQTFFDPVKIINRVKILTQTDVLIGVPEEKGARKEGESAPATNAELAYYHEFGAPANNLPARAALIPGIKAVQKEAVKLLERAAKDAMAGKGNVDATLNKVGLLGQNSVRAQFVNNDWEPLKDATLDYAALKKDDEGNALTDKKGNKKRKKSRGERGRTNPLIDTGQLRKAHTYVLRPVSK